MALTQPVSVSLTKINSSRGLAEDADSVDHLHAAGDRPHRFLSQLLVVVAPDPTTKMQLV